MKPIIEEVDVTVVAVGSCYRHFKGVDYEVIGIGRCSESLEVVVLYRTPLNPKGTIWVRTLTNFLSNVFVQGSEVPRFALVE